VAVVDQLVALLQYKVEGQDKLKEFNRSLDALEKKGYAVGQALGKGIGLAGAAIATGLGFLGKSVIDTSAQFEKFAVTLEVVEGSAEKAKKALEWVEDFATRTPYEVAEVTAAFVKLRSYGFDATNGTLKVLGDTAAAMGKTLNQTVEAFADATTGEFERLKELGIRSKTTGDQVTFTWVENGKEISKTVKKNATEIGDFLTTTLGKKFGGAMDKLSKTWSGMWSNMMDAWSKFMRKIGEAGFFDSMKKRLDALLKAFDRMEKDGTLKRVAKFMSDIFEWIADKVGFVFERIVHHIDWMSKNWKDVEPILKNMAVAFGILVAAAFPLTSALAALMLIVEDFMVYKQGGKSLIGELFKILPSLETAFKGLFDTGMYENTRREFAAIYQFFVDIGAKIGEWGDQWNAYKEKLWQTFKDVVADWTKTLTEWIATLPDKFTQLGKDIATWMLEGMKKIGSEITDWFLSLFPSKVREWLGVGSASAGGSVSGSSAGGGGASDSIRRRGANARTGSGGSAGGGPMATGLVQASGAEGLQSAVGVNAGEYETFRKTMAGIESGGRYGIKGGSSNRFSGAYQFGAAEIRSTALRLGETPPTREQFLSDPAMQERYMANYTLDHHNYLMKHSPKYRELSPQGKMAALGYAHNQGAGWGSGRVVGATQWLETGKAGTDAFNTSGTVYSRAIAGNYAKQSAADKKAAADKVFKPSGAETPYQQFRGNYDKVSAAGGTINKSASNSSNVNVTAPVNVHVAKADQAPEATARAVGGAVNRGARTAAKPGRMQASAAA
jgi:hypothetical protein